MLSKSKVFFLFVALWSVAATAEEPRFRLSHTAAYLRVEHEQVKETDQETFDHKITSYGIWGNLEIAAFPQRYSFYFTPDTNTLQFGYFFSDDLELGVGSHFDAKDDSRGPTRTERGKESFSHYGFQVFARKLWKVEADVVEWTVTPGYHLERSSYTRPDESEFKENLRVYEVSLQAGYAMKFGGERFEFVPEAEILWARRERKTTERSEHHEIKRTSTVAQYIIRPVKFRYHF